MCSGARRCALQRNVDLRVFGVSVLVWHAAPQVSSNQPDGESIKLYKLLTNSLYISIHNTICTILVYTYIACMYVTAFMFRLKL